MSLNSNLMIKSVSFALSVLLFVSISSTAWATTDLGTLGKPTVTIRPISGSPGTTVTITVSNLPDISNQSYPYPDLYLYLPFSKSFGTTVPSHCGGVDCFPVYTFGDAQNKNLAVRTITFTLFGVNNPSPVYLGGTENTICDVLMNNKTELRYSTLCNAHDQPNGTYNIQLAWALESNLDQNYVVASIPFNVTKGSPIVASPVINPSDQIIKEYQNNTISESQFENELKALGWNAEQIRQAAAVIGKLPQYENNNNPVPEFGPMASEVLIVSILSIITVTTIKRRSHL